MELKEERCVRDVQSVPILNGSVERGAFCFIGFVECYSGVNVFIGDGYNGRRTAGPKGG